MASLNIRKLVNLLFCCSFVAKLSHHKLVLWGIHLLLTKLYLFIRKQKLIYKNSSTLKSILKYIQDWRNKLKRGVGRRTLGGTQDRNTVGKIGKYWNTVSKINEIPIPHLWSVTRTLTCIHLDRFVYLKHVCTSNQPQQLRAQATQAHYIMLLASGVVLQTVIYKGLYGM